MTEMVDSNAIRDAIVAAQEKATAVPLRESYGDDATVHNDSQDPPPVEIPSFEGFTDFELDLTCLSPPASPPASIYTDARSNTPSASPRHSISLSFRSSSPIQPLVQQQSPPRNGPVLTPSKSNPMMLANTASAKRGSWPLIRYIGRGTPIDKSRRFEWGGQSNDGDHDQDQDQDQDGVGEDGVLFTTVHSITLDSKANAKRSHRQSYHYSHRRQNSRRSVSPEWNAVHRRPSTLPDRRKSTSSTTAATPEPPTPSPAIQIELGSENPEEWTSFMQTVLGESSASSSSSPSTSDPSAPSTSQLPPTAETPEHSTNATDPEMTLTPEEISRLDPGIDINLGIDGALDLGLGYRGGTNWFDPGMSPGSGRETPSLYSSQVHSAENMTTLPDNRSVTSVVKLKEDNHAGVGVGDKNAKTKMLEKTATETELNSNSTTTLSESAWWRKMLRRLRRVHFSFVGSH